MMKQNKKICKQCGLERFIWSGGKCKQCASSKSGGIKTYKPPTKTYKGKAMPIHTTLYMDFFGYDLSDYIPSEIGGAEALPAIDIHHVINRSKCGGAADHILNLMALTREQHEEYGDRKEHMFSLIQTHLLFMKERGHDIHALMETLPPCLDLIKEVYKELL